MSKERFIEGLNQDLIAEWETVIRYTYQAGKCVGLMGEELRAIYAKETADELQHASFLTDVIFDLGGEPATAPGNFKKPGSVKEMLELDLKMEEQAIKNYTEHAALAEELGEAELKVKLEEMAAEEAGHARDIRRLLRGI